MARGPRRGAGGRGGGSGRSGAPRIERAASGPRTGRQVGPRKAPTPRAPKPLDQLSPAYRKRIERAQAKAAAEGREFTRQQARGHKAREHVERARHEIEREGITRAQRQTIERWHERNHSPGRERAGWLTADEAIQFAIDHGYEKFAAFRKVWDLQRAMYVNRHNNDYVEEKRERLEWLMSILEDYYDVHVPDEHWLYYRD